MRLGVASTRHPARCTYGFGVARRMYDALCRKAHGDRGADADFALQIQDAAVQFDEGLAQPAGLAAVCSDSVPNVVA